jgi:hypothetical protein
VKVHMMGVFAYGIPRIAIAVTTKSAAGTTRVQRPLTPKSRVQSRSTAIATLEM